MAAEVIKSSPHRVSIYQAPSPVKLSKTSSSASVLAKRGADQMSKSHGFPPTDAIITKLENETSPVKHLYRHPMLDEQAIDRRQLRMDKVPLHLRLLRDALAYRCGYTHGFFDSPLKAPSASSPKKNTKKKTENEKKMDAVLGKTHLKEIGLTTDMIKLIMSPTESGNLDDAAHSANVFAVAYSIELLCAKYNEKLQLTEDEKRKGKYRNICAGVRIAFEYVVGLKTSEVLEKENTGKILTNKGVIKDFELFGDASKDEESGSYAKEKVQDVDKDKADEEENDNAIAEPSLKKIKK